MSFCADCSVAVACVAAPPIEVTVLFAFASVASTLPTALSSFVRITFNCADASAMFFTMSRNCPCTAGSVSPGVNPDIRQSAHQTGHRHCPLFFPDLFLRLPLALFGDKLAPHPHPSHPGA